MDIFYCTTVNILIDVSKLQVNWTISYPFLCVRNRDYFALLNKSSRHRTHLIKPGHVPEIQDQPTIHVMSPCKNCFILG